jgi:hypothetical protein
MRTTKGRKNEGTAKTSCEVQVAHLSDSTPMRELRECMRPARAPHTRIATPLRPRNAETGQRNPARPVKMARTSRSCETHENGRDPRERTRPTRTDETHEKRTRPMRNERHENKTATKTDENHENESQKNDRSPRERTRAGPAGATQIWGSYLTVRMPRKRARASRSCENKACGNGDIIMTENCGNRTTKTG